MTQQSIALNRTDSYYTQSNNDLIIIQDGTAQIYIGYTERFSGIRGRFLPLCEVSANDTVPTLSWEDQRRLLKGGGT